MPPLRDTNALRPRNRITQSTLWLMLNVMPMDSKCRRLETD